MKMKLILLIVAVGTVALALTLVSTSQAGKSGIVGTDHDVGSPGNPACAQCHLPHDASGDYLWAKTPSGAMSGLGSLCFSCHDGTVAVSGQYIPTTDNHLTNPGTLDEDCDRCHDPHADNWKFATDDLSASFANANLCASGDCHASQMTSDDHAVDVLAGSYLPTDRAFDPNASDFSGTRLFNAAGDSMVATGDAYLKCGSCHSPHGAISGSSLNSMAPTSATDSHSPLCENCHQ